MAQTSLMPPIKTQFFDSNGNPAAGGKVYTWMAGTNNTAKASYTDSTGDTANTNPVTLDSVGMAAIWLSGYYHIQAYDAAGNLIADADNVSSMPNTVLTQSQWVSQNITLTYVDGDNFTTPGTLTTTFEVGLRVKATVSAGDIYGTVASSTAGGTPVVTTVTVTWDSGQLDSGLSALWTGIISVSDTSFPTESLVNATATPTANRVAKFNASGIMKGAELNMTGEASNSGSTAEVTLDLGTVTSGDRILILSNCAGTASEFNYGRIVHTKSSGTATMTFASGEGATWGGMGQSGYGSLVSIIKVTGNGSLVMASNIQVSTSGGETYTHYVYAFFLRKA